MTSPYITPGMLKNLTSLGIDWNSIPNNGGNTQPTPEENLAALFDICAVATNAIETECFQPLRSSASVESLNGPDYRLTLEASGVVTCRMEMWPITDVLGVRTSLTSSFPYQWQPLPVGSARVREGTFTPIGPSFTGQSGATGMNEIEIQAGYISWGNGRNGYVAQIAYISGWPTAGILPSATIVAAITEASDVITGVSDFTGVAPGAPVDAPGIPDGAFILSIDTNTGTITLSTQATATVASLTIDIGYARGVTELNVDDVTGLLGTSPSIFDASLTENTTIAGTVANTPYEIQPGVVVNIGEGVITLAAPTRYPHVGTRPCQAIISAMPANVREAGYYYAGAEALQRGSTSYSVQSIPGSTLPGGGTPSIGSMTAMAKDQLGNFHRIV